MMLNEVVVRMRWLRRAPLPVFNDLFATYDVAKTSYACRYTL